MNHTQFEKKNSFYIYWSYWMNMGRWVCKVVDSDHTSIKFVLCNLYINVRLRVYSGSPFLLIVYLNCQEFHLINVKYLENFQLKSTCFHPRYLVGVSQSLIFCVVFGGLLFILSLLRCLSLFGIRLMIDYPFGIFTLFMQV